MKSWIAAWLPHLLRAIAPTGTSLIVIGLRPRRFTKCSPMVSASLEQRPAPGRGRSFPQRQTFLACSANWYREALPDSKSAMRERYRAPAFQLSESRSALSGFTRTAMARKTDRARTRKSDS